MRMLLLGVLGFCFAVGNVEAETRERVAVGVIAPLTGNAAHIGNEITRTVEVMRETLKDRRTTYGYEFFLEDGRAAVDTSPTTAFFHLTEIKKAKFLISATSGETLQIGPLAQKKGVLTVAVISSHKDVKRIGDYVFRTFIDVERGMQVLSQQIRNDKSVPLALLTEDSAFNRGIKELFTSYLKGDLVYVEDYEENSVNLRPILLKAKARGAKGYYLNCAHPGTCAIVLNQAKQLGIIGPFYSYLHTDNPEFLAAAGKNANGVRFLSPPDLDALPKHFQDFLELYRRKYNQKPTNDFLVRTTFDALTCIVEGIERVGPEPGKVKRILQSYKQQGALGEVEFDENGDIKDINYVMKEIVRGVPRSLYK